jgi:curved DNA-binding protein CbpA
MLSGVHIGVLIAGCCLLACIAPVDCKTDAYYDIVEALLAGGPNFYEILDVTPSSTEREVKKAYRKLSVKYHPDKNQAEDAADVYLKINKAFEILKDEDKRRELDYLLEYGVPWHDRYVGQHVHAFSRDVDIRYAVPGFVIVLSAIHYMSRVAYHHRMHRAARQTARYAAALKAFQKRSGVTHAFLKRAEKNGEDVDAIIENSMLQFERDTNFKVVGAELPTWSELLIVRLVSC